MKQLILIIAVSVFAFGCKKKDDSPTESPIIQPNTPAVTVKVSGISFTYNSSSSYFINPTRAVNLVNSNTSEQLTIKFLSAPTTGTFTLVKYGSPAVQYFKNSNVHSSVNGTLIVNAVTTNSSNIITKLNCTFNCQTDTNITSNTYYNLTEGNVDYNQ